MKPHARFNRMIQTTGFVWVPKTITTRTKGIPILP